MNTWVHTVIVPVPAATLTTTGLLGCHWTSDSNSIKIIKLNSENIIENLAFGAMQYFDQSASASLPNIDCMAFAAAPTNVITIPGCCYAFPQSLISMYIQLLLKYANLIDNVLKFL